MKIASLAETPFALPVPPLLNTGGEAFKPRLSTEFLNDATPDGRVTISA
jgi:hypothetical protein